jgi:hypothetical protein
VSTKKASDSVQEDMGVQEADFPAMEEIDWDLIKSGQHGNADGYLNAMRGGSTIGNHNMFYTHSVNPAVLYNAATIANDKIN